MLTVAQVTARLGTAEVERMLSFGINLEACASDAFHTAREILDGQDEFDAEGTLIATWDLPPAAVAPAIAILRYQVTQDFGDKERPEIVDKYNKAIARLRELAAKANSAEAAGRVSSGEVLVDSNGTPWV